MIQETIYTPGYPRGEYQDTLIGPQGEIIWQRPWQHNLIVVGMGELLARRMKGDDLDRIAWWAVGAGDEGWDIEPNEKVKEANEKKSRTDLVSLVKKIPIEPSYIVYAGGISPNIPTNTLEIKMDFTVPEIPQGPLREFGLMSDRGVLINYHIHPRIDLTQGSTLRRTLHLSFAIQ